MKGVVAEPQPEYIGHKKHKEHKNPEVTLVLFFCQRTRAEKQEIEESECEDARSAIAGSVDQTER